MVPSVESKILNSEDIKAFIDSCFSRLDIRDNTKKEYIYFASYFVDFLKDKEFNRSSFRDYKRYLAGRNDLAVSTKNKYLTSARILLKEMSYAGLIPVDITQNTKSFGQVKKHKKDGLNEEEIQRVANRLLSMRATRENMRAKAIISLMLFHGLRQCEIVRLDVKDIDLASKVAHIQGKGSDDKERIFLHPQVIATLKQYLTVNKIADGALFVSWSNNSRNKRITTYSVRAIVGDVFKKLNIEKSAHGFRHYFATKLIIAYKGDLLEVAHYTRHRSIEMLQVYNDSVKTKADLPRFHGVFNGVSISKNTP